LDFMPKVLCSDEQGPMKLGKERKKQHRRRRREREVLKRALNQEVVMKQKGGWVTGKKAQKKGQSQTSQAGAPF